MNKTVRSILALAAIFSIALAFVAACVPARAQAADAEQTSAALNATIDTAAAVAQPFIVTFAQQHPWLLTALAAMAAFRVLFKPLVSAAELYVRSTPQKTDDEALGRVTHSKAFKAAAWLLDYLGSIKIGPQFTAKPKPEPARA